jgi:hypothetical protein
VLRSTDTMMDHSPVTPHSHGASFLALIALVAKSIEQFITNEHYLSLMANYVAIISGTISIVWVLSRWVKTRHK